MEAAESLAGSSDPGTALEDADRRQLGQSADQQPEGDLPVLDAADGGEDPGDAVDFSKREERIGERRAAAMEAVATEALAGGFHVGVLNSRGAVTRAEGGGQERELAARYRAWAKPLALEFLFVSQVLEGIARSYDRDATHWDSEAVRRQRMEF